MQIGKLAKHFCNEELPLRVLKSHAGYYIGTFKDFPEGDIPFEEMEKCGPFSRESVEYFPTEAAAIAALETGEWTQKRTL